MLAMSLSARDPNRIYPLSCDHLVPEDRAREQRPSVVEEHEDDGYDPTIDGARDQSVNEAPNSQKRETREDRGQQGMALQFRKHQPENDAEYVDHLKRACMWRTSCGGKEAWSS